jgi:hypothetical protein
MTQSHMPELFTAVERRRTILEALTRAVIGTARLRHKALYACFFGAVAAGAWKSNLLRTWMIHRRSRPPMVNSLVNMLKAGDFYGWMRSRNPPKRAHAIPLDRRLRFGAKGAARAYQWYGWSCSGQAVDWCIGAEAALFMAAPDTTENLIFEAQILTFIGGPVQKQELRIYANEELVYADEETEEKWVVRVDIPSRTWRDRHRLTLRCCHTERLGVMALLRWLSTPILFRALPFVG